MTGSLAPAWFAGWRCVVVLVGAVAPWWAPMSAPAPTTLDAALTMLVFGWGLSAAAAWLVAGVLRRTRGRVPGAWLLALAWCVAMGAAWLLPHGTWPLGVGALAAAVPLWASAGVTVVQRVGSVSGRGGRMATAGVLAVSLLGMALAMPRFRSRDAMWHRAVVRHPDDQDGWQALFVLRGSRDDAAAVALLDRCLAAAPQAPWCLQHRASQALATGDCTRAADLAERAAAVAPDPGDAVVVLARSLARVHPETENALAAARRATAVRPGDGGAWLALALSAYAHGDAPTATQALTTALGHGETGLDARLLEATLATDRGDLEGARAAVQAALRLAPTDARARYDLGLVAQRQGHFNEAREAYLSALRADPRAYAPRYNLAVLTRDAGATDEARHHVAILLRDHPGDASALALQQQLAPR